MTAGPTLVLIVCAAPARQAEALRAALGLTLRGAAVEVAYAAPPAAPTPLAARAIATLRLFGHPVGEAAVPPSALADALARAAVVEVWT